MPPNRRSTLATLVLALAIGGCGSAPTAAQPAAVGPSSPAAIPAPAPGSTDSVLPAAQAYVDAVNAADLEALVASFAPEGEIVDVTRRIRGQDAIRSWADNEVIGGTLRVDGVTAIGPDT